MQTYGVYLDPSMLRNVLRTDIAEARELFSWRLFAHVLLYAGLPLMLLWRIDVIKRPWQQGLKKRLTALVLAFITFAVTLWVIFQPLSSLMRNHKEIRYLITPANYLWSLTRILTLDVNSAIVPRQTIGTDAQPGARWVERKKPWLVVMVVGETARAANWGLNGYARQTTPELAKLPVINFPDVSSCGTNTEVSLPCMFAPVGRRDYDEKRIRQSESLLHVVNRAGVNVLWRDNQSGCKGVCEGLPNENADEFAPQELCKKGHCLDEALLNGLDSRLENATGTQLWVMHQLGNHGPAYFQRYPAMFARFQPACLNTDLARCTREQIVNAYDNALLYTDHVLSNLIKKLEAQQEHVDSVLIYVSDHGESLGENNIFLHGMPYTIAPKVQTQVPMVMWFSKNAATVAGVDLPCLRQRALGKTSHDHLFHTVLSLLDVRTSLYEPEWDLMHDCRTSYAPTRLSTN